MRSSSFGVPYFAYGSNMSRQRLAARGIRVLAYQPAILPGYELTFDKRVRGIAGAGYANVQPNSVAQVEGVLYVIEAWGLQQLDRYEGTPAHYERITMPVMCADRQMPCAVYIANPRQVSFGLRPPREYMAHLLSASALLSWEYRAWLQSIPLLPDTEKMRPHRPSVCRHQYRQLSLF